MKSVKSAFEDADVALLLVDVMITSIEHILFTSFKIEVPSVLC